MMGTQSNTKKFKMKRYISKRELADYLFVTPKTIELWTEIGLLFPERVGPKLVRYDILKVEQWLMAQNKEPNPNVTN